MGRNAVDPTYEEDNVPFEMDHATVVTEGNTNGNDVAIITCGEMVKPAKDAARLLKAEGISASVLDMYCIKPLDEELVVAAAKECGKVVTVEEHSVIGGLGSAVCDVLCEKAPTPVLKIGVQDVFGESGPAVKLLEKYKLDGQGVYEQVKAYM